MSKEERSELKRKLEQMEDEGDSQEGSITVMPNVDAKIPPPNPDEQQPLDQWDGRRRQRENAIWQLFRSVMPNFDVGW